MVRSTERKEKGERAGELQTWHIKERDWLLLTDGAEKCLAPQHHLSVSLKEGRQRVALKVGPGGGKPSIMDR